MGWSHGKTTEENFPNCALKGKLETDGLLKILGNNGKPPLKKSVRDFKNTKLENAVEEPKK